ncbi:DsrE/DsrF/TusD sulfur relay family protein [Pulveribacter sp.]|uniref:DsrE/DsrF/TusD sulfur relay family protein n=1 Tax=Pulveribacter sp. TaxID=2678893 RepID=UPI00289FD007|nr:DsrE family protein [Pulveribacter sp.]
MPGQQHIVVIIHAAAYGSERCLSGLRVANTLAARDDVASLRVFLMSDATVAALPHQHDGTGSGLQALVQELVAAGATLRLCRTCALARGLAELPLIEGVAIGTLPELGDWIAAADKVITF